MRHTIVPSIWRVGRVWPIGFPVEHPIRVYEFSQVVKSLSWKQLEARNSLITLFDELSRLVQAELQYYYRKRQSASRRAKFFRAISWACGSVGILTPIVHPVIKNAPDNFLSWGYIAVALAGIFLVADKIFSGSEAHARFVHTQLKIEHGYTKFSLEWEALLVAYDTDTAPINIINIIEKFMKYVDSFHDFLGEETTEWMETLKSVKEELNRQAQPSGRFS